VIKETGCLIKEIGNQIVCRSGVYAHRRIRCAKRAVSLGLCVAKTPRSRRSRFQHINTSGKNIPLLHPCTLRAGQKRISLRVKTIVDVGRADGSKVGPR
jgi:hypothetical protein